MKNSIRTLILSFIFITSSNAFSQEIKLESGDLSFLKGQTQVTVEYNYSEMAVAEYPKEADYVTHKMDEANKTTPGSGDKWFANWKEDRTKLFQPEFEYELNKRTKSLVASSSATNTTYTLIVKITYTDPGYYKSEFVQKKGSIRATFTFVDSKDHSKVLAVLKGTHLKSSDVAEDTSGLVVGAYAEAGILLGDQIVAARKAK